MTIILLIVQGFIDFSTMTLASDLDIKGHFLFPMFHNEIVQKINTTNKLSECATSAGQTPEILTFDLEHKVMLCYVLHGWVCK